MNSNFCCYYSHFYIYLIRVDIMELMHRTAYWSKGDGEIGSVYMAASGSGFSYHCNETDFGKPYSDEV
jgi:hypothetical protein